MSDDDTRVAKIEWQLEELAERRKEDNKTFESRLRAGASSFSKIRAWVVATAIGSIGSVFGVIWQAATHVAESRYAQKAVEELRAQATRAHEEEEGQKLRVESLTAQLRAEQDRRGQLEDLVRALAARRR